jgi:hypothetical protein
MRKRVATIVIAATVAWASAVASASECPGLIQQVRDALEEFKRTPGIAVTKEARVAAVEANLRSSQSAHEAGQHDEAIRHAKEALRVLGR